MGRTSTVSIDGCDITVRHRLYFYNHGCDPEEFSRQLQRMKRKIESVWRGPFRFQQFCEVRFEFDFVESAGDVDEFTDVKQIVCRPGVSHQKGLGPEKTIGVWYLGDEDWVDGVAAHEVGHELGMDDKYECLNADGDIVPCYLKDDQDNLQKNPDAKECRPVGDYPEDGIAFSNDGVPKPVDIQEIMDALGVECPCPLIEFDEEEDSTEEHPNDDEGHHSPDDDDASTTDEDAPRNDCLHEYRLAAYGQTNYPGAGIVMDYSIRVEGTTLTGSVTSTLDADGTLDMRPWEDLNGPLIDKDGCERFRIGHFDLQVTLLDSNGNRVFSRKLSQHYEGVCPGTQTVDLGTLQGNGGYLLSFGYKVIQSCAGNIGSTSPRESSEDNSTPPSAPTNRHRRSVFWDRDGFRPDASDGTEVPPPTIYGEELEGTDQRPLFFVPGFMGSSLDVIQRNGKRLSIWPPSLDNTPRDLRRYLDLRRNARIEPKGLYPEVYDDLIDFILRPRRNGGLGHIQDETFWIFPYDWRLADTQNGRLLRETIRRTLERVNARRRAAGLPEWDSVDVINHSNGGLVTRSAIIEYRAPIHKTVYLASPHLGTPEAYFPAHPGITYNFDTGDWKTFFKLTYWYYRKRSIFDPLTFNGLVKRLSSGFLSSYDLSPDRFYLTRREPVVYDHKNRRWIIGAAATYLRGRWAYPRSFHPAVQQGLDFKDRLGEQLPGDFLVFWSKSKTEHDSVNYYIRALRSRFGNPYAARQLNGDGTATAWSASLKFSASANFIEVSGGHNEVPNIADVHAHIRRYLPGN